MKNVVFFLHSAERHWRHTAAAHAAVRPCSTCSPWWPRRTRRPGRLTAPISPLARSFPSLSSRARMAVAELTPAVELPPSGAAPRRSEPKAGSAGSLSPSMPKQSSWGGRNSRRRPRPCPHRPSSAGSIPSMPAIPSPRRPHLLAQGELLSVLAPSPRPLSHLRRRSPSATAGGRRRRQHTHTHARPAVARLALLEGFSDEASLAV